MDHRLTPKHHKRHEKRCPHCGASNPPKAYACLSCFKVMVPKQDITFWSLVARPAYAALGLALLLFVGAGLFLKTWLATLEAKMTINLKTAEYQLSLVAGKLRKEGTQKSDKAPTSPPPASSPDFDVDE